MRPHFIIFFLFCALISASDLDVEDTKIENDVEAEKTLEKRQLQKVSAQLVHDVPGSRYICPPNYELINNECHHVDCPFEGEQTNVDCLISATAIYTECEAGQILNGGRCMKIVQDVVCPQGTSWEGNECVFRVPGPPVVYVDFVCPAGSVKDTISKQCIFTAQVPQFSVQCPVGYQRVGDICYYQALRTLSFRCPDNSLPINNVCFIQVPTGNFRADCPPNSRPVGNNICELIIPQVTMLCADGSQPDRLNNCHMRYGDNVTVVHNCPPNTRPLNGKCYIEAQMRQPVPEVAYMCPNEFKRVGNKCVMDLHTMLKPEFKCPENYYREGDACVYRIDSKRNYEVKAKCPHGSHLVGRGCQFIHTGETGTCERIINSNKCCKKRSCKNVATRIHNVNHVYIPTNITSTNIATINIGQGSSSSEKAPCKTEETIETSEEEKPENEKCCTVVSPRVCENRQGNWECGHREYQRCGSMCVQDTIHLKASRPMYHDHQLVMPPPQYGMRVNRRHGGRVNCYGCLNGRYNCSPECYEYDCANDGCNLMEQNTFCGQFGGEGCAQADGYYNF